MTLKCTTQPIVARDRIGMTSYKSGPLGNQRGLTQNLPYHNSLLDLTNMKH